MKTTGIKTLFAAGILSFAVACTSAPQSDTAVLSEVNSEQVLTDQAQTFQVNPQNSLVEWVGTKTDGRHNGTVNVTGGELSVEDGKLVGGRIVLDMTTLDSKDEKMDAESNTKLTGHLKNADFFEVETYPEAVIVITGTTPIDNTTATEEADDAHEIDQYRVTNPTHIVTGNMTIKGITKGVSFPAQLEITDNGVKGLAKFNIDRRDWGIDYTLASKAVLSNTIHLGVALEATNEIQAKN